MAQGGKVDDAAAPPFATKDGKTKSAGGEHTGHDFLTDNKGSGSHMPGRDFTKENRPQSDAEPEVVPAKGEIPKGGKDMKADPSGPAGDSGDTEGVNGRAPFKGLK